MKFKSQPGFKAVPRPNAVSGTAVRHIRVTPAESAGTPAAGPAGGVVPGFYFADDEESREYEDRLNAAVGNGKQALRKAELDLATFFSTCVTQLFREQHGAIPRQPSRAAAESFLFVSLSQRYEMQAFELREKNDFIADDAFSPYPEVRLAVAANPWATSAELAMLSTDASDEIRQAALSAIDDSAE